MEAHSLLLFAGVDLLLVCTPGPDWLYVIARGLGQGRRAALTAVAGLCTTYAAYTLVTAAGLAAAVKAAPGVLPGLRIAGAAYLVFLAVRTLLAARRGEGTAAEAAEPAREGVVFRQSVLTGLLNPKALLLFFSLLPQFTDAGAAIPPGVQVAVLGAVHIAGCALVYGGVALASARTGRRLRRHSGGRSRRLEVVSAALLLAVAAVTASTV